MERKENKKLNGSGSIEPQRNKTFSLANPIINSVYVIYSGKTALRGT